MSASFKKSQVVALFVALDYVAASKWSLEKLTEKVKTLPSMVDDDTEVEGDGLADVLAAIIKADGEIKIEDDADTKSATKSTKKGGKKGGKKETVKDDDAEDANTKSAKGAGKKDASAKKTSKKGSGVCQVIMDEFLKGSKESPVTKEHVLKILVKKFPDREEAGMKSTVSAAPSWMVSWKGLKVYGDKETGFYARQPKK